MSAVTVAPVRRGTVAAALAAPVLLGAAWLVWSELAPPMTAAVGTPFVEALREDEVELAFEYIQAGLDPNAPVPVRDAVLTGGEQLVVAPLLIAVGYNRPDAVLMLMSNGARVEAPGNRLSACLAQRMELQELAEMIVRYAGAAASALRCPEAPHVEESPLLAYVE